MSNLQNIYVDFNLKTGRNDCSDPDNAIRTEEALLATYYAMKDRGAWINIKQPVEILEVAAAASEPLVFQSYDALPGEERSDG